jgi:holin-like protein
VLLGLLLSQKNPSGPILDFRQRLITTANSVLEHLSLLFVPIGVGVVMHLQLLESQLVNVLGAVIFGTMTTIVFTSFLFQALRKRDADE